MMRDLRFGLCIRRVLLLMRRFCLLVRWGLVMRVLVLARRLLRTLFLRCLWWVLWVGLLLGRVFVVLLFECLY